MMTDQRQAGQQAGLPTRETRDVVCAGQDALQVVLVGEVGHHPAGRAVEVHLVAVQLRHGDAQHSFDCQSPQTGGRAGRTGRQAGTQVSRAGVWQMKRERMARSALVLRLLRHALRGGPRGRCCRYEWERPFAHQPICLPILICLTLAGGIHGQQLIQPLLQTATRGRKQRRWCLVADAGSYWQACWEGCAWRAGRHQQARWQ